MQPSSWWSWLRPRNIVKDHAILREVVRRIIHVAQPDEIILFGSAARGQLRGHSDFDLLVVKSGVADPQRLTRSIHAHLFGIRTPVDVVVATPEDLEQARSKSWTLLGRAQIEGKRIYAADR